MSTILQHIFPPGDSARNMGGNQSFYFVPVADVVSIPPVINGNISDDVVFDTDKAWYEGYGTLDTKNLDEKQNDGGARSDFYDVVFSAFVPSNKPLMHDLFERMSAFKFIVLVKDNNGRQRLLGTLTSGMRFRFEYSSQNAAAGRNGYTVQFSRLLADRPPFYNSSSLDLATPGCEPVVVTNSDNSYNSSQPSGSTLVLPDITHFDSDGSSVTLPAQNQMYCTPDNKTLTIDVSLQPGADTSYMHTITYGATLSSAILSNCSSPVYKKNGLVVSLPFSLVNNDTLQIEVTITNISLPSSVTINGTHD